jgi:hypothetical protein
MFQGGDWSINRYAAVVAEGVEQLSISGCTFSRLDNTGVFLVRAPIAAELTGVSVALHTALTPLGCVSLSCREQGGYTRDVAIEGNEFAWLGESAVVSLGDTAGGPVPGWGVDGTAGDQPRGTKLWYNFGRELGMINKQSALYFQAVTDGADVRGNVAFNGARSGANFNDCFGSGSNFSENVRLTDLFGASGSRWVLSYVRRVSTVAL